jgi:hypothetical protein
LRRAERTDADVDQVPRRTDVPCRGRVPGAGADLVGPTVDDTEVVGDGRRPDPCRRRGAVDDSSGVVGRDDEPPVAGPDALSELARDELPSDRIRGGDEQAGARGYLERVGTALVVD